MRSDFQRDYDWQDTRIPLIIDILRQNAMYLLSVKVASQDKDTKQATDLLISVDGGDVSVRLRRPGCRFRDLTIRSYRSNGHRTEIDKIREGFARWYLYCWMDDPWTIGDWLLVDLDELRESGLLDDDRPIKVNPGGRTGFKRYNPRELDNEGCVLATNLWSTS